MLQLDVDNIEGRHGGGHLRFGKSHPDDNIAELSVNPGPDAAVSVLVGHQAAVWLMAHLGACIKNTAIEFDISVMDEAGTDYQGLIQISNAARSGAEIQVSNHTTRTAARVVLGREPATTLMAELGAFIAST